MLNDPIIARMFTLTACLAVLISVLAIAIRVIMDGLGPQLAEMTDALIKIALGGGLASGGTLLVAKAIDGNNSNAGNGMNERVGAANAADSNK